MKICLVAPYDLAEAGGVKRHVFQLAAALRAVGDEVTVMGASSVASFDPEVAVFGGILNVRSNGSDNRLALLTPPWRIQSWFAEREFDVIHVHEPLCPLLAPWAALCSGPTALVATFHAYAEHEGVVPRLLRRLSSPLLDRYQRGIAVSKPAATYASYVWQRELAIIPNGIATELFAEPLPRIGPTIRLLFIGHWRDARKGLSVALEAVSLLRARGVPLELAVIGSGPSGQPAPEIDGVTFHGAIANERDVAAHLAACDILVAPSTGQESFGIVLLEAMACGRAIVCSAIDGYRQVVGEHNARLVEPGSVHALALAIEQLAGDPAARRAMAVANRARAMEFAWSSLVHEVRAQYELALATRLERAAS